MTFTALIVVCRAAGNSASRSRRSAACAGAGFWAAHWHGATALVLILLAAACALLIAANLRSYQRLSFEQPAGELQLTRTGDRESSTQF